MKRRKTTTILKPFDHLPNDVVKLILAFVADDAKSLTRCLVVDKRFHDLVTKSETVNYWLNQWRNNTNLNKVMRLFPSLKHIRLKFLWVSVGTYFTRWKAVASTKGLLYVMVTVHLPPIPPSSSSPPMQPSGPHRVPHFAGPFEYSDKRVDEAVARMMLGLRPHVLRGCSLKSLTLWAASDGRLVIESDPRTDYDLSGYNKMPLHCQHWTVQKMELPLNNRVTRVMVAVVKRSYDPIELDKDVLLLVDAFKDDEGDLAGGMVNEIAMEISKHCKEK